MKYLSLLIPNPNPNGADIPVQGPAGVPTGGLSVGGDVVSLALQLLFIIAAILAVVFIMISGLNWITSGGDEKKIEKAKARLTYSIVGLVVVVGSFFIINTVLKLLGQTPGSLLPIP